jgi:hypothetical protein
MSTSVIILEAGSNGTAQVKPNSYPKTFQLSFEPQGSATLKYGTDGAQPTVNVPAGETVSVEVKSNSMNLDYSVSSDSAKIQWSV